MRRHTEHRGGTIKLVTIVFILALCVYASWRGAQWYEANAGYLLSFEIEKGDIEGVKRLVKMGARVDGPGSDYFTPLYLAAQIGHAEIVEFLLQRGARLDLPGGMDDPLLHAAAEGGNREIVELFLELGLDPNAKDYDGQISLHVAPTREIAALLLQHGADVDAMDDLHGITPLHRAVRQLRPSVVAALLEHGANVGALDSLGHTPIWVATWILNVRNVRKNPTERKIIDLLLVVRFRVMEHLCSGDYFQKTKQKRD